VDTNRPFQFQKRSQLFIRTHNETLSVVAMCAPQSRSFARWNQWLRRSPNSSQLAEIISAEKIRSGQFARKLIEKRKLSAHATCSCCGTPKNILLKKWARDCAG
jgi:hypothetical protein